MTKLEAIRQKLSTDTNGSMTDMRLLFGVVDALRSRVRDARLSLERWPIDLWDMPPSHAEVIHALDKLLEEHEEPKK